MTDAITREEKLMKAIATGSPSNIKPITRDEMFLAKAGGQDVETPEPITRREKLLQGIIDNGGGGGSTGGGGTGGGGSIDKYPIGDGNTHFWVSLSDGRTSPTLSVATKGTVTIDWGDGTEPDVITSASLYTLVPTKHEYTKEGNYVITLICDAETSILGYSSTGSMILTYEGSSASTEYRRKAYQNSIRKVEVGNNMKISGRSFEGCYGVTKVTVPSSMSKVEGYTFAECSGAVCFDFTSHNSVPTLSDVNAFNRIAPDCEIRIPSSLYDEWINATNWSTLTANIVIGG